MSSFRPDATLVRRHMPAVLTVLACVLIWFGYDNIAQLRGTFLWELRYVALGCAAIVLLTVVERLSSWLARRTNAKEH